MGLGTGTSSRHEPHRPLLFGVLQASRTGGWTLGGEELDCQGGGGAGSWPNNTPDKSAASIQQQPHLPALRLLCHRVGGPGCQGKAQCHCQESLPQQPPLSAGTAGRGEEETERDPDQTEMEIGLSLILPLAHWQLPFLVNRNPKGGQNVWGRPEVTHRKVVGAWPGAPEARAPLMAGGG